MPSRSISAGTATAHGWRTGPTRFPISPPTPRRSPDKSQGQGQVPVSIGASLGGIASLLALREPGEPVFAGLILVDVVPKMNPRGVDHIQGFMRDRAHDDFASIEEAAEAVAAYLPHRRGRPRSTD